MTPMTNATEYVKEICQLMPRVYELAMHPPSKEIEQKAMGLLKELNDLLLAFEELLLNRRPMDFGEANAVLRYVQTSLKEIS